MATNRPSAHEPADWSPTEEVIAASNMYWLMRHVGAADYRAVHRWSVEHRADYWELVAKRLAIRWRRSPSQTLDVSRGVEHARWFVGGRLNIAESCFSAPPESLAILEYDEAGERRACTVEGLNRLSSRVALGLQALGIRPGDAVGLVLPLSIESVAAYLGVVKAGAVAVGIADSFSSHEIATRLRIADARWVITQDVQMRAGKQLPIYERVRAAGETPAVVIVRSESTSLRGVDRNWEAFLADSDQMVAVERDVDDDLNILFSSGTTGDPKAIPWTPLCPLKCAADAHFHHDIHPGDILAWPTSLGWMMGPWLIYASLLNKATMALFAGAPGTPMFGRFVEQARVTMLGVIPSLVASWRATGALDGCDWSSIRCFSSTGECSNADDMRWLMARAGGKPVLEYCGGTEVAGGYISGTVVLPIKASMFNTLTLGTDAVILDEQGRPASKGEMFLIPPAIGMSTRLLNRDHHAAYYADCPRGPRGEVLRRHGDEMERTSDGFWRAHGRVDDTMNLGGIKVGSAEIERVLNAAEGVRETAAVAHTPEGGGPSRLVIFAVLDTPRSPDELRIALQSRLSRELNPLFRIHEVVVVDSLPRTASNKVMRRLLRSRNLG